jgi:hypothetical protein
MRELPILRLIYLDIQGIAGLYHQLDDYTTEEKRQTTETGRKADVRGKFAARLLPLLFGGAESSLEGGAETNRRRATEETLRRHPEQQFAELKKRLAEAGELKMLTSVGDVEALKPNQLPLFATGTLPFALETSSVAGSLVDRINQDEFVEFVLHAEGREEDFTPWDSVHMGASLAKMPGALVRDGHATLQRLGHDAMLLRSMAAASSTLGFFGHMSEQAPRFLYVKPYAIWL